jgi:adenosylhomocysteine nucleosidase
MLYRLFSCVLLLLLSVPNTLGAGMKSVTVASPKAPQAPIMIQGPMPIEAEYFAGLLTNVRIEKSGNATFYLGELEGYPIVVAQTGQGLENTAAATAIGIERYKPLAIINQGTSGGHDPALQVGDIVLGKRAVNTSNFKTPSELLAKDLPLCNGCQWILWLHREVRVKARGPRMQKKFVIMRGIKIYLQPLTP